jgi:large subunit ribosomal protein L9
LKVVLLQDVPRLGKAGEVKEVADGYGRNFLFPKKLAALATRSAIKESEIQLQQQKQKQESLIAELAKLAQQIEGCTICFKAKVTGEDHLYGSIRDIDIVQELSKITGSDISKENVALEEPIRRLGSYEITVRLAPDLAPKITVTVEQEEAGGT